MKLIATLIAAASVAAKTNGDLEVVGGQEAKVGSYLWTVTLRRTPQGQGFCGGTLIAPQYVLTAAHCVGGSVKAVSVGSHFISGTADGEQLDVEWVKAHPLYKSWSSGYDVALVKLKTPSTIQPIKLQRQPANGGDNVRLLGWGRTAFPGNVSSVLKELNISAVDSVECQERLRKHPDFVGFNISSSHLCAGGEVDKAACHGDSGGPLVSYVKGFNNTEEFALVGDVSAGVPCGKGYPDLYGRVSAVTDFIDANSQGHVWAKPAC